MKNSKSSKDNHRPVSILSNISKVYEKFILKQMIEYFKSLLSKISIDSGRDPALHNLFYRC